MPATTNRRHLRNAVIAVAHQTAFGTAAATSAALQIRATRSSIDADPAYVDVRGTSGSYHPKDTHWISAKRPRITLEAPMTRKALCFFGEHTLHGQPRCTQAGSDLSIAGDTGSALSALVLNGVRPHVNTSDAWTLFVTVTDETPGAGQAQVSIYSDAARTVLVAQGSGADSGSVTLAEQNNSGLSGTVTIAAVGATNAAITVTIAQVRLQRAGSIDRWFTFWRDSGVALERVYDCTVTRLVRRSQELGPVLLDVEIVGTTYDHAESTTFTPSLSTIDTAIHLHDQVAVDTDTASGDVAQSVFRVEVELRNDIQVDVHNATKPTSIWKRGVESLRLTLEQRFADEAKAIVARGLADTWTAEQVVDTHGGKDATWTFAKTKSVSPRVPDTGDAEWARVVHTLECREESASSPAEPFTLIVEGP